jgi:hypothetical protein
MHDVPDFLWDGFDGLIRDLSRIARQQSDGATVKRLTDTPVSKYLGHFANLVRRRNVRRVVLLSDSLEEPFPDERFGRVVAERLHRERNFSFHAFVGVFDESQQNRLMDLLRDAARNGRGTVRVTELGMKPLLQGLFTNREGICQGLQLPGGEIQYSYLFRDVDLTESLLDLAHSYLRFDEQAATKAESSEDTEPEGEAFEGPQHAEASARRRRGPE